MAIGMHTEEAQEQAASPEKGYQVLGTRPIRHDGTDKVTGRALYGAAGATPPLPRTCGRRSGGRT